MPLGIVSRKDFEKEIRDSCIVQEGEDRSIPTVVGQVITPRAPGRSDGDTNVPDSIRKLIGEEYAIEGRAAGVDLAKALRISPSAASAYGNGSHSTASYDTPTEVRTHINNRKDKIVRRASSRVLKALENITDDKLAVAKASDLASIAKSLSGVVKDMEPEDKGPQTGPNIQFVMFAPKLITEERFGDPLEVNE